MSLFDSILNGYERGLDMQTAGFKFPISLCISRVNWRKLTAELIGSVLLVDTQLLMSVASMAFMTAVYYGFT